MLKEAGKLVAVAAASAVVVPYTTAVVAHTLYGWPANRQQLMHAFLPGHVYALNYALLRKLSLVKYAKLYFEWRSYYRSAPPYRLMKDLPYGTNGNTLDLHFPAKRSFSDPASTDAPPIVVFIYGGAWGSGDKDMYGLLCAEVAKQLQAVVCCPNQSTYPKGYVDDMVQDVVDCIGWLHENPQIHNANKNRIMLMGHSSGAHLSVTAVLELTKKRLQLDQKSMLLPEGTTPEQTLPLVLTSMLSFADDHFDGSSSSEGEDPNAASNAESFYMLSASAAGSLAASTGIGVAESQQSVESQNSGSQSGENNAVDSFLVIDAAAAEQDNSADDDTVTEEVVVESPSGGDDEKDEEGEEEGGTGDGSPPEGKEEEEDVVFGDEELTQSQRETRDILNSIKCVIGLAGVYDIGDHYNHETYRGVELISTMAKAMYEPIMFSCFSPTTIIETLPARTRLPPITVVHGTTDKVVPPSSSDKLAAALLALRGCAVTQYTIPECDHYQIMLALMDPKSPEYQLLMGILHLQASKYL